jgi:hypothetical protein
MNDSKNFVSLDLERVKGIIRDRLNVEPFNTGICTEYKGSITVFNDRILEIARDNDFYALVPSSHTKSNTGKWLYDISNFKIYRINKQYLDMYGITVDPSSDGSKLTSIKLSNKLLVYCSSEGLKNVEDLDDKFLNSREFACLILRIPRSGSNWLDSLIEEANLKNVQFPF